MLREKLVRFACAMSVLGATAQSAQAMPIMNSGNRSPQQPGVEISPASAANAACINALPAAELHRSIVYLHAEVSDSGNSSLAPQAALMASQVADTMRVRMGGTSTLLPSGDSLIKPSTIPAQLVVTLHADGSATRVGEGQYGDTVTPALLEASFDAIRKNGDGAMVWPDGYTADSVVVKLILSSADVVHNAAIAQSRTRHEHFAVFDALLPIARAALPRHGNPDPRYPFQNRVHHVSGNLLLQFVVDTSGHAVLNTMHDVWPADKPRLTGELGGYYDEFLAATMDAVLKWKFYPAFMGSCAIPQTVQLPISYQFQ
jgi:hypothetical protein